MVRVPKYRAPSKAPNTVRLWFEDANCYNMEPELFEPLLGEGLSREETLKANEERLEQALRACSDCPVWHLCYQKGEPDDFYYTTRAGMEAGQLTVFRERGRVRYRGNQQAEDAQTCAQGHNNWKIWGKKRPRRMCVTCSQENAAKQRAKRAGSMEE